MVDEMQKKDETLEVSDNVKEHEQERSSPSVELNDSEETPLTDADKVKEPENREENRPEITVITEEEQGEKGDKGLIEGTEKKIAELEKEVKELQEKNLRLYAEFDNFKKRTVREKDELRKYGNETLIENLLPVIDNLEMALHHKPEESNESALHKGVELTLKELLNTLKKYGLESISAVGKPFDPLIHHAMSQVESDEEENTVVSEFRKGYMLHDRVLRASLVSVSKKSEKEQIDNHETRDSEEE